MRTVIVYKRDPNTYRVVDAISKRKIEDVDDVILFNAKVVMYKEVQAYKGILSEKVTHELIRALPTTRILNTPIKGITYGLLHLNKDRIKSRYEYNGKDCLDKFYLEDILNGPYPRGGEADDIEDLENEDIDDDDYTEDTWDD